MKHRDPAQVSAMFPGRAFGFLRVERGYGERRKMTWVAFWSGAYYTSDTDRLVDFTEPMSEQFGDTPEEALGKLVQLELDEARAHVASCEKELATAREQLRIVAEKMGEQS